MSTEEQSEYVTAEQVFGDLKIAPLPEGTQLVAGLLLAKLSDGTWCVRVVGDHDETEFLGALVGYTHAATIREAEDWLPEE